MRWNLTLNLKNKIQPKLSIGIPVYNGEKFIKKCLNSILNQTFTDFEIILSDNASTDSTSSICQEYANKDQRILFIKQKSTEKALWNYNFVLHQAKTEYFMWASADDIWHPKFIEKNLMFLEKHPNFVGSTSEVEFFTEMWDENDTSKFKNIQPKKKYELIHPLVGTFEEKVKFIFNFKKFEYTYAIFRTNHLKKCIIKKPFMSWEVALILKILKYGNLNVEDGVMMFKYMGGKTSSNYNYTKLFSTTKNYWGYSTLASLFPFVPLTFHVFNVVGPKIFLKHLLKHFIKDNYRAERLVLLDIFSK
tara:strand:+ start:121 stop:1035 length:915 start_codon:yes stop_codon:yes gene_type:complete